MMEGNSTYIPRIPDTGYTALCPGCGVRHRNQALFIGRERWVAFEKCRVCQTLPVKPPKRKKSFD